MQQNYSKKKIYKSLSKSYSTLEDIRKRNEIKYLTIRKKRNNSKFNTKIKNKINNIKNNCYKIIRSKLRTNNANLKEFSLDFNRPAFTMSMLVGLLKSKDDNNIKFGLSSVRNFFETILDQRIINDEIIEKFLENKVIQRFFDIMKTSKVRKGESDLININEIILILINMVGMDLDKEENKNKFFAHFTNIDNLSSLISIINIDFPLELIYNSLILFCDISNKYPAGKETLKYSGLIFSLKSIRYDYRLVDVDAKTKIDELLNLFRSK